MNRFIPLLLIIPLLAVCLWGGCLTASADTLPAHDAFSEPMRYSIADGRRTGLGLAFCITLNAAGVERETDGTLCLTDATVTYGGETCPVIGMGAVATTRGRLATDALRRESAGEQPVTDIPATKLYAVTATTCTYVARIVDIPAHQTARMIYLRPYVEIVYGGESLTLYGEMVATSYARQFAEGEVTLPACGDDVDGRGRLLVGDVSLIGQTLYLEIVDVPDEWMTLYDGDAPDVVYYACYNEAGEVLCGDAEDYGKLYLRDMGSLCDSETFVIALPEGTAAVRITDAEVLYWTMWEPYE